LVTGHTGFKGSWLTHWLTRLGAEVGGFSVDVPTSPANFNVLHLEEKVRHHLGDIRDRSRLSEVIDEFRPEIVFHLAAQALVLKSYVDPLATFEVNTMGMANLLECLRARPWVEVAVLVTSDKVYRNDEWCWGYRETDALGGHDPYGGSKSCAELVAHSYFHSFLSDGPTRVATARAGNVIGGGDWAPDRIVPDCIRAWSNGVAVTARSPWATRPWQHVLEPLSGYLLLGQRLWEQRVGLNGEAFNFGPPASVTKSVGELLTAMAARWPGAAWQPSRETAAASEATLLKLSCDKALFQLQWQAALHFEETVALTIDWYRAWHEDRQDMSAFSVDQLDEYCRLASTRGLPWVGP
jgi:CDP-glucose 4,6-dehydratase